MKTAVVLAQQKWECYSVTAFTEQTLLNTLNEVGQDGWEPYMVAYYKDPKGSMVWTAFLKRPSSGQPVKSGETGAAAGKPEAAAAGKPEEKGPSFTGFDLAGDTFEIKPEPVAPKPEPPKKPEVPKKPESPAAGPKKA